jgi:hypothetical protein
VDDPAVGSGLSAAGLVVSDPLGTGDAVGVAEPLGVADGVTDGDRDREGDREGDRVGVGTDRVGLGVAVDVGLGLTFCWADAAGTGTGRTRMYSARMARNKPAMIRVEVRGRPLTRHPRWTGRYRGRRRR